MVPGKTVGPDARCIQAGGVRESIGSAGVRGLRSSGNDVTEVRQQGGNIVVSLASATGRVSRTVPAAQVSRVVFTGLAGNDTFTNQTAIPSRADGGAGADAAWGGASNDRLMGGVAQAGVTLRSPEAHVRPSRWRSSSCGSARTTCGTPFAGLGG